MVTLRRGRLSRDLNEVRSEVGRAWWGAKPRQSDGAMA